MRRSAGPGRPQRGRHAVEVSQETSLLAKALWSAGIVLGLTFVAERVGTRAAGILSGAPLNAVLVYFFVGRDLGVDYVVASVPHAIAAFTATLAFVLAWYRASTALPRFTAPASAVLSSLVFVALAAVLVEIPFSFASATALTAFAIAFAIWLFRRIEFVPVRRPVRYTPALLLARGGLAAALVVTVIGLAGLLGPRWAGVLAGFPATLLPTLAIVQATYGTGSTHAMIRGFPVGVVSIILYIASVPVTFPRFGVAGGTAASLAVSFAYLAAAMRWRRPGAARRTGAS